MAHCIIPTCTGSLVRLLLLCDLHFLMAFVSTGQLKWKGLSFVFMLTALPLIVLGSDWVELETSKTSHHKGVKKLSKADQKLYPSGISTAQQGVKQLNG